MTREKMIAKLVKMANKLRNEWSWDAHRKIWEMCIDWNREHEDEEIFMCEHENEETGMVDGFYIEDDYWTFEE